VAVNSRRLARGVTSGKKITIHLYTLILLINMASAVVVVAVLGGPVRPAIFGAVGAGAFLYLRHRSAVSKRVKPRNSGNIRTGSSPSSETGAQTD
jgi:hypothetical protein